MAAALYPDVRDAFLLDRTLYVLVDRLAGDWAGLKPSEVRDRFGAHVLMRQPSAGRPHVLSYDETPLAREEHVLAVTARALQA